MAGSPSTAATHARLRSGLFFTFVWPVVVAVMFGFMFAGESQGSGRAQLRIVVVDEDHTEGSRAFFARLGPVGRFRRRTWRPGIGGKSGARLGHVQLLSSKPGFGAGSTRMFYGEPRRLEIGSDPARSAEAGMIDGLLMKYAMAPLTHAQVLGGKALACFLAISILQTTIFALGAVLFGVRPGSLALLVLACVCASAGFVGFMMMVASLGKTEQAVAGAGWAMLMPMAMLGGAMIPQFVT
jgi:hypothetical protein